MSAIKDIEVQYIEEAKATYEHVKNICLTV